MGAIAINIVLSEGVSESCQKVVVLIDPIKIWFPTTEVARGIFSNRSATPRIFDQSDLALGKLSLDLFRETQFNTKSIRVLILLAIGFEPDSMSRL